MLHIACNAKLSPKGMAELKTGLPLFAALVEQLETASIDLFWSGEKDPVNKGLDGLPNMGAHEDGKEICIWGHPGSLKPEDDMGMVANLSHEIGHIFLFRAGLGWVPDYHTSMKKTLCDMTGTFYPMCMAIGVFTEEKRAWDMGWDLLKGMRIPIERTIFNRTREQCLGSYLKANPFLAISTVFVGMVEQEVR